MPIPVGLLPLDVLAKGISPPNVGALPDAFWAGQDRAQQQQLQNLFSGGLPHVRDAQGNPVLDAQGKPTIDYNQMAEQLARVQGAGAIPTLTALRSADIQQQALKQNENLSNIFPPLPSQPRIQTPPSILRPGPPAQSQSSLESDQGGGVPKAGDVNVVRRDEVPGSAQMSVDGGPMMALASEPQQPGPAYPRQFSNVPGPATDRFTPPPAVPEAPVRVAQATTPQQPPANAPARPPVMDPGDPGYWTLENARAYDRAAYIFNMRAQNLGVGGLAAGVPGPKQQADQLAARANQIYDHIAKMGQEQEKSRLQEQRTLPEAAAKAGISKLEKSQEKADTTAQGILVTQDLYNQINSRSGIFTGAWANEKLKLARIAEQLGYPIAPEQITNTQAFMSIMGQRVASGVKAFGSGTSITNQDREYVAKMVGGDITLDETSIRRILDITDKLNRGQIQKHNDDVDRMIKSQPAARPQLEPFKVEMPPKITGRTTEPKPGPAGARQETFTGPSGRTYKIITGPDGRKQLAE